MPYDTKADFDAAYSFRVERYFGGHPNTRPEVRVNYHRWAVKPILADMWNRLAPILSIPTTNASLIVGAGFGWGIEAFKVATGVTNAVGIDISDYIAAEQSNTEEAELRTAITAVGLDPDTGRGLELMGILYDAQPRTNVVVLQSDMSTQNERQLIRTALGGNWPDVVIFEDIIGETTTDAEIVNANNAGGGFGGTQRRIWITGGTRYGRTPQDLQTLTGAEVITRDGSMYIP